MKKQILSIGTALNKAEQKTIIGGTGFGGTDLCKDECKNDLSCPQHYSVCATYECKIGNKKVLQKKCTMGG